MSLFKIKPDYHTPWSLGLYFSNNAAKTGGGVYISDSSNAEAMCSISTIVDSRLHLSECFLQTVSEYSISSYDINGVNFVHTFFANNIASLVGNDIYGGLLDRCTVSSRAEYHLSNKTFDALEYILNTVQLGGLNSTNPLNKTEVSTYISSASVQLCFCFGDNVVCNDTYQYPNVKMKKGEPLKVRLAAVNQVGNPVRDTIVTSFTHQGFLSRLKEGQEYQHIKNCCTDLWSNVYSNESTVELVLFTEGPCRDMGISKRKVHIDFSPCTCPIGFEDNSSPIDCKCACDKRLKPYVTNCYTNDQTIEIKNVWVDFVNGSDGIGFVISSCPFDYCVQDAVNITFQSLDNLCANNRSGVLCGECKRGMSLVFSSSRCKKCSNYYLFLIIPFCVLGVVLVIFILVLNTTPKKQLMDSSSMQTYLLLIVPFFYHLNLQTF